MNFWTHTTATPSLWQTCGLTTLDPGYIRSDPPELMPNPVSDTQIIRASDPSISNFLETHYGGADWHIDAREWFSKYSEDPKVIILCMYKNNEILGLIVSTPLTDGNTYMSHGVVLSNVRVIEGLCIHPAYRSKGLAGVMINRMDHYTHTAYGPTVHLWSREMMSSPFISSALNTHTYGYIDCRLAKDKTTCEQMTWNMFVAYWKRSYIRWLTTPCIVTDTPLNRRNDLTVWTSERKVAVVANTRRKSDDNRLWEVVWCGEIANDLLWPANSSTEYNHFLESIAANIGNGLLFASDYIRNWTEPWVYGASGIHAWHIYNYVPPAFRTCVVHAIREEL